LWFKFFFFSSLCLCASVVQFFFSSLAGVFRQSARGYNPFGCWNISHSLSGNGAGGAPRALLPPVRILSWDFVAHLLPL
jgi:hypothetical protein